jgi:hypothetical protein
MPNLPTPDHDRPFDSVAHMKAESPPTEDIDARRFAATLEKLASEGVSLVSSEQELLDFGSTVDAWADQADLMALERVAKAMPLLISQAINKDNLFGALIMEDVIQSTRRRCESQNWSFHELMQPLRAVAAEVLTALVLKGAELAYTIESMDSPDDRELAQHLIVMLRVAGVLARATDKGASPISELRAAPRPPSDP